MTGSETDFPGASWYPSPNVGERREGRRPDILLLHYTAMESADAARNWLCTPESQVSCHYLVDEDGTVTQMVREAMRAWHAGQGAWKSEADVNSASIGIEIQNRGHEHGLPDFPERQIAAVIALSKDIIARHGIAPERVLAHSDIAPARKRDPGERFPWQRLHDEGVGHWVAPEPVGGGRFFQEGDRGRPVEALQSMLALYGYDVTATGDFDGATTLAVTAFQRHFRPARVDGIADASTITTLHRLLAALPGWA